jgi:xanthine dehydrogenase YagS FAD-binding subunit
MLPNFRYVQAKSVKDAVKHLAAPEAMVHAGGTDLLGCLRDHVFCAQNIVSISRIKALRGIKKTAEGGLRIGALSTLTEVAENPLINRLYPGLAQGAAGAASPQLRNQGTLAGNLCQKPRCWYYRGEFHCVRKGGDRCYAVGGEDQFHCIFGGETCYIVHPSDTAPPLAALEATVKTQGPDGSRTVPVETFHMPPGADPQRETILEPGEIVTEILLPPPVPGLRSSYRKVRARRAWDFALAGMALALQLEEGKVRYARVVFSGVAPVPWRSVEVEDIILGKKLDKETIAKAAHSAAKSAAPMKKNGYKIPLLKAVVEEEFFAVTKRTQPT